MPHPSSLKRTLSRVGSTRKHSPTSELALSGAENATLHLVQSLLGTVRAHQQEWPDDPDGKARIFNKTTRFEYRLKAPLDVTTMTEFDGDIDKITDVTLHFLRRAKESHIHVLKALRRFFWAIRAISRAAKRKVERNRELVRRFTTWWAAREDELREEYYARMQGTHYAIHTNVGDSVAEFKKTCTDEHVKEVAVRTLIYRRRVEYLRKRRQWRMEYRAKVAHLRKLQQLYGAVYLAARRTPEQQAEHLAAIKDARIACMACAVSGPTLVISEKNVSLEQLLHLTVEIERKQTRRNRDTVLTLFEQERAAEIERKRQLFLDIALKREQEYRATLRAKQQQHHQQQQQPEPLAGGSNDPLEGSYQRGRRYTTISSLLPEAPQVQSEEALRFADVATRRSQDGRRFRDRLEGSVKLENSIVALGSSSALVLQVPSPTHGLESSSASHSATRFFFAPTPKSGTASAATTPASRSAVAAATAAALARDRAKKLRDEQQKPQHDSGSQRPGEGFRSRSPPGEHSHPQGGGGHVENIVVSREAKDHSRNERDEIEMAARKALEERRRREAAARQAAEIAQRAPPPDLPTFFSLDRPPAVATHSQSTLHVGSGQHSSLLGDRLLGGGIPSSRAGGASGERSLSRFDAITHGRASATVQQAGAHPGAEARMQFQIHRFRDRVTEIVDTSFGKIRLAANGAQGPPPRPGRAATPGPAGPSVVGSHGGWRNLQHHSRPQSVASCLRSTSACERGFVQDAVVNGRHRLPSAAIVGYQPVLVVPRATTTPLQELRAGEAAKAAVLSRVKPSFVGRKERAKCEAAVLEVMTCKYPDARTATLASEREALLAVARGDSTLHLGRNLL
jgi:hypothetical protein